MAYLRIPDHGIAAYAHIMAFALTSLCVPNFRGHAVIGWRALALTGLWIVDIVNSTVNRDAILNALAGDWIPYFPHFTLFGRDARKFLLAGASFFILNISLVAA